MSYVENKDFTPCVHPSQLSIHGKQYTILAERYEGYGILTLVYIHEGKVGIMRRQDDYDPVFYTIPDTLQKQ